MHSICPHCGKRLTVSIYAIGVVDWAKVDWGQSNAKIARRYQVTYSSVVQSRSRHAPETIGTRALSQKDWSQVDWSQRNPQIARQMGCNPWQVSYARSKFSPLTVQKYVRKKTR